MFGSLQDPPPFPERFLVNDVVVVCPAGRLRMADANPFQQQLIQLLDDGKVRVVVDLADVDTFDSSILAVLIRCLKLARAAGGDLRLARPPQSVRQILEMTKLTNVLLAYESPEAAFAD